MNAFEPTAQEITEMAQAIRNAVHFAWRGYMPLMPWGQLADKERAEYEAAGAAILSAPPPAMRRAVLETTPTHTVDRTTDPKRESE